MDELRELRSRVDQIEETLATLQQTLQQLQAIQRSAESMTPERMAASAAAQVSAAPAPQAAPLPQATPAVPAPRAGGAPPPPPPPPRLESASVVARSEYWLNRVGIALLLLGLAFLFNYAIDQGWLTPLVRLVVGALAGAILLGLGLWLRQGRPSFAYVLQGGGVAAWYITNFAAFQLYSLLPYPLAFGLMCLVTLLCFALAVWQNALPLALIAALGGLGTPFVLMRDSGSIAGLVGYTSLVLSGIVAIALARSWRPLLWTGFVGGWAILLIAVFEGASLPGPPSDRWPQQLGILWAGLLLWPLPALWLLRRPATAHEAPAPRDLLRIDEDDVRLLALLTPFFGLALSGALWEMSQRETGAIAAGLTALAALAAWLIRRGGTQPTLAFAHTLTALLMGTTAIVLLLEGNAQLIVLAAEALIVLTVALRRGYALIVGLCHGLFALIGLRILTSLLEPALTPALLNLTTLSQLLVLGLAAAASLQLPQRTAAQAYWLTIHILLLGVLGRDLSALPNGNAYTSIAWGVYGLALLIVGLRRDIAVCTLYGIGTLGLVVAKLLLVDLAEVAAIWRVLLFLGFGTLFLVLSYFFQALWRRHLPALSPSGEGRPAGEEPQV